MAATHCNCSLLNTKIRLLGDVDPKTGQRKRPFLGTPSLDGNGNEYWQIAYVEETIWLISLNLVMTQEKYLAIKSTIVTSFKPFYTVHKKSNGKRILLSYGALGLNFNNAFGPAISTDYYYKDSSMQWVVGGWPESNTYPSGPRPLKNTNIEPSGPVVLTVHNELNGLTNRSQEESETIVKILGAFEKDSNGCLLGYPNCGTTEGNMGFPKIS